MKMDEECIKKVVSKILFDDLLDEDKLLAPFAEAVAAHAIETVFDELGATISCQDGEVYVALEEPYSLVDVYSVSLRHVFFRAGEYLTREKKGVVVRELRRIADELENSSDEFMGE